MRPLTDIRLTALVLDEGMVSLSLALLVLVLIIGPGGPVI
jgi:hypothetical protein